MRTRMYQKVYQHKTVKVRADVSGASSTRFLVFLQAKNIRYGYIIVHRKSHASHFSAIRNSHCKIFIVLIAASSVRSAVAVAHSARQ